MGKLGPMELVLVLGIALLIFGPSKLPELGKTIGKTINEFKSSMNNVTDDVRETAKDNSDENKES